MTKSKYVLLAVILSISFLLAYCSPSQALPPSTPAATQVAASPLEMHLVTSSGLTIDQVQLKKHPGAEPFTIEPVIGTQAEILAIHALERQDLYPDNFFSDGTQFGKKIPFGDHELKAVSEETRSSTSDFLAVTVNVSLDNDIIFTLPAGDASPIGTVQGLWEYDNHWILEAADVHMLKEGNSMTVSGITGMIVQDGKQLNEIFAYQESFAFQLLAGKPFYFFRQNGKIDISYDDQVIPVEYDEVIHYQCCSAGVWNPIQARNRVAFFALDDGLWYYVDAGVTD